MQKYFKNIHLPVFILFIIFSFLLTGFYSCRPAKLLQEDEFLVNRYKISSRNIKHIKKDELSVYVKQKPNKRFLGLVRFRLAIYNTFSQSKRKIPVWITENMGEAPVIYDEFYTKKSAENINLFLNSKGYYNSTVTYKTKYRRKLAFTNYEITTGIPYRFRSIRYEINDTILKDIVLKAKKQSYIRPGQMFDSELLKKEQQRLTDNIRNRGYFSFSKEYVNFSADTANGMNSVDITVNINDFLVRNNAGKIITSQPHQKFIVDSTFIIYNFNPKIALKDRESYLKQFDTIEIEKNIFLLWKDTLNIKPKIILQSYFIKNGNYYRLDSENRTKQQLSLNKFFKLVTIKYSKQNIPDSLPEGKLNCFIEITPFKTQSFAVELEGTNTNGDWGTELNLNYKHKNLFHGSEILSLKLKAGLETDESVTSENKDSIFYSQEYGIDVKLEVPKFLFPFKSNEFDKKFRPKTIFNIGYNYEKTKDYTKPAVYFSYGYFWLPNIKTIHKINIIDVNGVSYENESPFFENVIKKKEYYKYSYEDYYIYSMDYTYTFSNQNKSKTKDYQFFKYYFESSGNILYALSEITDQAKENGYYETFNVPFSQYIKSDFDFRYYNTKNKKNYTVYRLFFGIGCPYGNSEAMPSIKKYFVGGANSMRAWSAKQLGPGSYSDTTDNNYHYNLGDIKLEANVEKRFHLFWHLDGALFVDIGNIWTLKDVGLKGSQFEFNKFYNDLAIGTGVGLRFDFSFLVLRTDLGMKIKDPAFYNNNGNHWIIGQRPYTKDDFNLNIGIGYPF